MRNSFREKWESPGFIRGEDVNEGYTDFNVETAKRIIKTNFTEYSNINPIFAITENGEQINIPKN